MNHAFSCISDRCFADGEFARVFSIANSQFPKIMDVLFNNSCANLLAGKADLSLEFATDTHHFLKTLRTHK